MSTELEKIEPTAPAPDTINVPKDMLATLIAQNKQAKDDNAKLLAMLNGSVEVIGFMKHNILGGSMPTEMGLPQIIKLATRIPKILNSLDAATMDQLQQNFKMILDCASEFMSDEQLKKISQ